ncbi:dihydrolipoamide acetyltransferase family protein [Streptomyces sp. NBC_01244]|uniref:dihydrolipoamide acetyltransferase family protein n=1 Tax=Streptomyces sp. NBC_01244 TaxID=2903797 RepID=UPI002E11B083|nr:2-oxo acid dehydrogenase subunit E2 [Streptomyces sp. NBC_01244]
MSTAAAVQDFLLPDLGEGLTEAEIVRWLVAEGDVVTVDQPVVEVETAKATVEVPSPYAGTVAVRHAAEGATLEVGRPLLTVTPPGTVAGVATTVPAVSVAVPAATQPAEEGSGKVLVGYGTQPLGTNRRRRAAARALTPPTGADPQVTRSTAPAPAPAAGQAPAEAARVVSPVVRALAAANGLDLGSVAGTGAGAVITRQDVNAALAQRDLCRAVRTPAPTAPAQAVGETRLPLRGVRGAIARKLTKAAAVPTATVWVDVDATELLELKRSLDGIGLLALLARFTVAGLRLFPELNATVREDEIVRYDSVHLGIAAQTDAGLLVPVVRDADRLTTRGFQRELAALVERARSGGHGPAELTGGTFTLNNYGTFGVDGSSMLLNAPEAGILGIGRIIERPWTFEGRIESRSISQLSLVFDHRVCDGAAAGGFLRFVADCVEHPGATFADL